MLSRTLAWPQPGFSIILGEIKNNHLLNEAVTELNWDVAMPPTAAVVEEAARPIEESVAGGALHGSG